MLSFKLRAKRKGKIELEIHGGIDKKEEGVKEKGTTQSLTLQSVFSRVH